MKREFLNSILLVLVAPMIFIGAGCRPFWDAEPSNIESFETTTESLVGPEAGNIMFGGNGRVGWLKMPDTSNLDQDTIDVLPECGSAVTPALGEQVGLGKGWDDETYKIIDACRDTESGLVAIMIVQEVLTEMPDGEVECLDYCDNTSFAIINPASREIKWSGVVTVGVQSEESPQDCQINGLAEDEGQDLVLFTCGPSGWRVTNWYAATTDGVSEPLWKVKWLESAARDEYLVLIDELVDDFKTEAAPAEKEE